MHAEHAHNDLNQKVCLECNRQFTGIVAACPHDGTLLVNVMQDPLIGTTLAGNYEIIDVAGHGGMGVVYKARHALMDRMVAIKMLHSSLISDSMSVKRFQQESKAASRINHPHVITVYDFGISPQGQPYIVMDFLQGTSLADMIKAEGQVGVERTIKILSQACDALDHAHKQGVVHRDLKPTNIVLINYDDDKDFVKVVDFGVAKLIEAGGAEGQRLTQAGEVCGSPVYMSPEQCTGLELDARSDIYSMGIMIYETLTGRLPLLGKTMVETMSKHISEMPASFAQARPDLYIPERLEDVCCKALAKDPADRHQSMEELKMELEMAIPRPGKSQVLRSAAADRAGGPLVSMLKGMSMAVWVPLAVAAVGGLMYWSYTKMHPAAAPIATPPVVSTPAQTHTSTTTPANASGTRGAGSGESSSKESASGSKESGSGSKHSSSKESGTTESAGAGEQGNVKEHGAKPGPESPSSGTASSVKHDTYPKEGSPEEIMEAAHQQKARPKIHKKPPHAAVASSSSTAVAKPPPASKKDPFAELLKKRGY